MKNKTIGIMLITLFFITTSCQPMNTAPPAYIKNIGVYKEGYDAIAVYFILADSSGAMTASNGVVTVNISLKRDSLLSRRTIPATGFKDPLMNRMIEKEAEYDNLVEKVAREEANAILSGIYAGKELKETTAAGMKIHSKYEKQIFTAKDQVIKLQYEIIKRHKASRTQVPKEYFPLWGVVVPNTIYLNYFDVRTKDFKNTKIGIGSFERKALVYSVGRIPFPEFASVYNKDDTGVLEITFETPDGKVFQGEETFYFK